MTEQFSSQPAEQSNFPIPILDQRAPENVQEQLGNPTVEGWGAMQPLDNPYRNHPSVILNGRGRDGALAEREEAGVVSKISTRIQAIRENYRDLPEKTKDKMQLRAMIGASAVLSLFTVYEYAEKYGGVGEKAALTVGLYELGGAAVHKVRKHGLPGVGIPPTAKRRTRQ